MSALLARTGRHKQRYDGDFRLVSGCVPYRLKKDVKYYADDLENRLEVLMISSPNRDDLVFPKGGWEDDETVVQAACREALEEAGVRGIVDEKSYLGVWEFRSKSRQNSCSKEGSCRGFMYALEVTEELEYWPEQASHERRWLTVSEASKLSRYDWMREALEKCLKFLSDGSSYERTEAAVAEAMPPVAEVPEKHPIMSKNRFVEDLFGWPPFCDGGELLLLVSSFMDFDNGEDKRVSERERKGKFSVQSFYDFLWQRLQIEVLWPALWKTKIPAKVHVFCWTVTLDKIFTVNNLQRRGFYMLNRCVMCKRECESIEHLFLRSGWAAVQVWQNDRILLGKERSVEHLKRSVLDYIMVWVLATPEFAGISKTDLQVERIAASDGPADQHMC